MTTVVEVVPCGTITDCGAVATVVSNTIRVTDWPPGPAGALSETVRLPFAFVNKFSGLGVRVTVGDGLATIVTVAGKLSDIPSFTINCATNIPATSAVKVG